MPEITVVIPARDAEATLPALLAALALQAGIDRAETIVVDDGSRDRTAEIGRRSPVVDRVLTKPHGEGPAAARNTGAAVAGGGLLAFLDADCRPTPGWLTAGIEALCEADLALGEVRPEPGVPLGAYDRTLWVKGLSPLFESANLFVRASLFAELGGFEGWLGPRAGKELGEDTLFGWRARRSGARIVAASGALAYHAIFPRGPLGYVGERRRLRFFPRLVGRVPELRDELLHRRLFLSRRSAAFDLALGALILAALPSGGTARRHRPGRALAVAGAAAPYLRLLADDLRHSSLGGRAGLRLVVVRLAADAVGAASLGWGSLLARRPVL